MSTLLALGRVDGKEQAAQFPISADVVISVGDMLWYNNTTVQAASAFTWDSAIATTRKQFRPKFAGISGTAHRAGDPAGLVKAYPVCEADVSVASATVEIGDLVGPAKASGNALEDQKVIAVVDPTEAIGICTRKYASQTTIRVLFFSTKGGTVSSQFGQAFTQVFPATGPITQADFLTEVDVELLFGGAIEVIAFGFYETVAVATNPIIANIEKNTTNLANLTVPTAGAAIGRYTEADMSADAARVFTQTDNFSIEVSGTAPHTNTRGAFVVRYRKLS